MTYLLPEAKTAICFAVPFDRSKIRPYLGKELPRGRFEHVIDNGDVYLKAYKFAQVASEFLEEKGFKSVPVVNNFKYREDVPNWRTKLPPLLSLRLVAARSGVGSIGWSGNILVKGYGAAVLLGALVTSAKLEPTDPIPVGESPCDKCKLCVQVCAYRMFDNIKEDSYTLGGYTFSFSKRNNVARCYAVCGGLSGLDKSKDWSTWSPGRTPFPETKDEADRTFAHLFAHPVKNMRIKDEQGSYAESKIRDDPKVQGYITAGEIASNTFTDNFILTCGNCQLICWGDRDERTENCSILMNSGCVVTNKEGENIIVSSKEADELEKAGEITDPYVQTSERRQYVEKIVNDIFRKLREEEK
ncbi:MAG: hypothetical protein ACXAAI_06740 [Promethearchaeota archaeon]|jgi:epoxyqueuosine reductase QueG